MDLKFLESRLALKEQKRKELYAKQGRGSQFTSRDQRDTWIQNELKSLSKAIKEKNEQIERLQEDLKVRKFFYCISTLLSKMRLIENLFL